jgi:hypothetical protein
MQITEPTTMLTDYALALLCAFFSIRLLVASTNAGGRSIGLWVAAFAVTAIAAILGGTAHGFRVPLGEAWGTVWRLTVWSIGASALFLIAAGVRSALHSEALSPVARQSGIAWLELAIGVSLAGLVVLIAKLSVHRHFNQNDLYHVIQMVGLYALYRGAMLLHGLDQ